MNKEFIPYEQALELKELGFDEECLAHTPLMELHKTDYNVFGELKDIRIGLPLYQQAFRWFREKHNILSTIYANASGFLYEWEDAIGGTHRGWSEYEGPNDSGCWDTYEEAELACLNKLIELVKNR
jgi:hypothetical protein